MKAIKLFILFAVIIAACNTYSQVVCVNPEPLSPPDGYQSVDPPTILITPAVLNQYCTAYGIGVFLSSPCGESNLSNQFIWGTDSFYTLKNNEWNQFNPNQTYYWGARTYYGTNTWTGCRQIKRLQASYLPAVLISPLNGAISVPLTPLLDWNSNGCTSFRIRIYSHPNLQQITIDTLVTGGYQVPPGKLQGMTTYWWRVKGYGVNGESPYSDVWHFTTIPAIPPVPNLISPPNGGGVNTSTPTLDWDSISSAVNYRVQVSTEPIFITFIVDDTTSNSFYKIQEPLAMSGYYWRVRAMNISGASAWSAAWYFIVPLLGVKTYSNEIPGEFELYNNYPNPFNPSTDIRFDIPVNSNVKITVYDINGRIVDILVDNYFTAGKYEIRWEAKDISSGLYLYKIEAKSINKETDEFIKIKKMVFIK
jgi:hypothetical protein